MLNRIAFINGKGGCGKTTSIFHIAGVLAKSSEKTLIIDFDKQRNLTDTLLTNSTRPIGTVYDFLFGMEAEKALGKAHFQKRGNANPKYYGIDCLVGDIRLENEKNLESIDREDVKKRLDKFIEKRNYSWLLVDMPPSNFILNDICFEYMVDFLIIPFSSDIYSVTGYKDIMDTVQKARLVNPGLNIIGVYLSRYMQNCAVDRYIKSQLEQFDTFIDIQIPLAADVRESVMFGRPISYYKEFSKSRKSYEALVNEIKIRIDKFRKGSL